MLCSGIRHGVRIPGGATNYMLCSGIRHGVRIPGVGPKCVSSL